MRERLFILAWVCITIVAAGMGLLFYWSFYPYKIMTIKNQMSLPIDKKVYQAGDRIIYTLDYCKTMDITGKLFRAISDGITVNYETIESNIPVGCHIINRGDLVIPEFLPSGEYFIRSTSEWQVNPIRRVTMNFKTEPFEVISKSDLQLDQVEINTGQIKINTDRLNNLTQ